MNINDRLIVDIIDEDNIGNGIAKINNFVIFIKNALINEKIEIEITNIRKRFAIGKIINIINKSTKRIDVVCPYYELCGGCNFLHTSYSNERDIKKRYLERLFNRNIEYLNTKKELNYRNKVVLHVIEGKLGYFKDNSNELCIINHCELLDPKINLKIDDLNNMDLSNINEIMIRCINNKIMINIKGNIKDFNIDCDSLYINNKYIKGEKYLIDEIDNYKFSIYPESFYQVNKEGMKTIYDKAKSYLNKYNSLLDLYCGIGSIGIWMHDKFDKIIGVEINSESIKNANINKELNNIKNIEFICDDAKNIKGNFDVIIVDPPRSGLSVHVHNYLDTSNAKIIIYISCNPNTLKRDIDFMTKYKIKEIACCDMFPRTKHCESITVLERR